jgi:pimeloyl-ACP methyl ester carboxylesterase
VTDADHDVPPPAWLARALAAVPERDERAFEVDGVAISTWRWPGTAGSPRIVLVHGGGAHAGWWSWTGPLLAPAWDVVAVELSGHGRSGRRSDGYRFRTWADETLAAAGAGPAVLVGHSMGGIVTALAAERAGSTRIPAVVVVDAPLERPTSAALGHGPRRMAAARPAATREALLARFRLVPDQGALHGAMIRHAAEEAIAAHPEGFAWRFDPTLFAASDDDRPPRVDDLLAAYPGHVGAIVAGRSGVVPEEHRARLAACCDPDVGGAAPAYVEVLGADHQIMFDRPLELLAALDGMLRRWGLPGVALPQVGTVVLLR